MIDAPLVRIRLGARGRLEVIDPRPEDVPLLAQLDADFQVRTEPLPGFVRPRLGVTRDTPVGVETTELPTRSTAGLWALHAEASVGGVMPTVAGAGGAPRATLLDLKRTLARRALKDCHLCAHRCGVDRTVGAAGRCRLGAGAMVAEHFVHVAEEPQINPSMVVSLAGCGLRCRFCQQWALLDPSLRSDQPLDASLWPRLDRQAARSLSFVGGNPDESLPTILDFLAAAPADWDLPVVWNTHAYATPEVLQLLNGVVDCYLPDFKFGGETCGRRLAGAPGYADVAAASIASMLAQGVPVIVRVLCLPGHLECCHLPALDRLAAMASSGTLLLSIRGQYCPDWKVRADAGSLGRRVTRAEVDALYRRAADLGLTVVADPARPQRGAFPRKRSRPSKQGSGPE